MVHYVVKCLLVYSAAENHLFEHLRSGGSENLALRSIQSYVCLCTVADTLKYACKLCCIHILPAVGKAYPVFDHSLHSADLRRHEIVHIVLISFIYE